MPEKKRKNHLIDARVLAQQSSLPTGLCILFYDCMHLLECGKYTNASKRHTPTFALTSLDLNPSVVKKKNSQIISSSRFRTPLV